MNRNTTMTVNTESYGQQQFETQTSLNVFSPQNLMALETFAKVMSQGAVALPKHLQGKPADCLAVALQASQWGMNPFAVAQKTHIINGTLGYEAQLVNAVIANSGAIASPFRYEYSGDWSKWQQGNPASERGLFCRVGAVLRGDTEITWGEPLQFSLITIRNSPLWKTNPKQQIAYLAVKYWARLYAPGAILGVYTPDELEESEPKIRDITPPKSTEKAKDFMTIQADVPPPQTMDMSTGEVIDNEHQAAEEINLDEKLTSFCEYISNIDNIPTLDDIYKKTVAKYFASSPEHLDKASEAYSLHKCDLQNAMQDDDVPM